jgi:phosphomannomutase
MILRTSGTEPKIKFYTEIKGTPGQKREEAGQVFRQACPRQDHFRMR